MGSVTQPLSHSANLRLFLFLLSKYQILVALSLSRSAIQPTRDCFLLDYVNIKFYGLCHSAAQPFSQLEIVSYSTT